MYSEEQSRKQSLSSLIFKPGSLIKARRINQRLETEWEEEIEGDIHQPTVSEDVRNISIDLSLVALEGLRLAGYIGIPLIAGYKAIQYFWQ